MNQIFYLAFFIIGVSSQVYAQPILEINRNIDFIEVDNLNNIYAVKESEIIKYSKTGEFLYRYSNSINGNIFCIDVTNPLRIVLFYQESNVVAFLNQQLTQISDPVNIFNTTGYEAEIVGASSEGGFWVFSVEKQSIMLFDRQMVNTQESQNINSLVNNDIEFIREQNQKIYMGLPQKVLVFDMFGSYLTTIHFKGADNIKISNDKISYKKNKKLFVYDLLLKTEVEQSIPVIEDLKFVFYHKKHIYIVSNNKVQVF